MIQIISEASVGMEFLEIGKIVNTHGIRGDVKIDPWCDGLEVLFGLESLYVQTEHEYRAYELVKAEPYKQFALVHFGGIDDADTAEKLKNKIVYVTRDQLSIDEDRVLIADIIGLSVVDAVSGETYGVLTDVSDGAAQQLYVIKRPDGSVAYMPAIREFIDHIELGSQIFVTPPEGLFDAL
ncbi:MAG: 16S rRNA processing protein RimM [Clostridiales bacterium]|nr:16S rRNA processing protein RimM [Clostridiales bacterium]